VAQRLAVSEQRREGSAALGAALRSGRAHHAAIRLRSRAISHRACSHSHSSALPHPVISSCTAIAGLIAQCPWITRDSWTGVTPSRAAAAIVRSPPCRAASGPMQPSAIAHPGCGGSRRMAASCLAGISLVCTPRVIVLVPDGADIRTVHAERDALSVRDADACGRAAPSKPRPLGAARRRSRGGHRLVCAGRQPHSRSEGSRRGTGLARAQLPSNA